MYHRCDLCRGQFMRPSFCSHNRTVAIRPLQLQQPHANRVYHIFSKSSPHISVAVFSSLHAAPFPLFLLSVFPSLPLIMSVPLSFERFSVFFCFSPLRFHCPALFQFSAAAAIFLQIPLDKQKKMWHNIICSRQEASLSRRPVSRFYMRVWRNWQTRKIQVLMVARLCRFKSCHPHQTVEIRTQSR